MRSNAADPTLAGMTTKKYLYKLRANSVYFSSLVLVQILAGLLLVFSSVNVTMSMSNGLPAVSEHTLSAQSVLPFSAGWAVIVSILLSGRKNTEAAFTFPGNRLTSCFSDIAFILTGCLFGAVTTVLFSTALRPVIFALHPGDVIARGFHPAAAELSAVGAAAFLYMLLGSAAGYLSGTLLRISKLLFAVTAVLVCFILFVPIVTEGMTSHQVWDWLFGRQPLARFALVTGVIAVVFLTLSTVISNWTEVRK